MASAMEYKLAKVPVNPDGYCLEVLLDQQQKMIEHRVSTLQDQVFAAASLIHKRCMDISKETISIVLIHETMCVERILSLLREQLEQMGTSVVIESHLVDNTKTEFNKQYTAQFKSFDIILMYIQNVCTRAFTKSLQKRLMFWRQISLCTICGIYFHNECEETCGLFCWRGTTRHARFCVQNTKCIGLEISSIYDFKMECPRQSRICPDCADTLSRYKFSKMAQQQQWSSKCNFCKDIERDITMSIEYIMPTMDSQTKQVAPFHSDDKYHAILGALPHQDMGFLFKQEPERLDHLECQMCHKPSEWGYTCQSVYELFPCYRDILQYTHCHLECSYGLCICASCAQGLYNSGYHSDFRNIFTCVGCIETMQYKVYDCVEICEQKIQKYLDETLKMAHVETFHSLNREKLRFYEERKRQLLSFVSFH